MTKKWIDMDVYMKPELQFHCIPKEDLENSLFTRMFRNTQIKRKEKLMGEWGKERREKQKNIYVYTQDS